jgi:hypothetical protein
MLDSVGSAQVDLHRLDRGSEVPQTVRDVMDTVVFCGNDKIVTVLCELPRQLEPNSAGGTLN